MEYQSLYRQYRPGTFKDVIGQEHIVRTLRNSVALNKVAHAYLFTGPRGTGKTSIAKILAKALNCVNGPTPDPCNECENCRRINSGLFLDVIEIDAASNRGINEIRDLREKVKFAPSEGTYKVYIIDEVHMLTTEAFNALLKTLEEPPVRVVFILATTDPQEIPATVVSRCQRFDFRVLSVNQVVDHITHIVGRVGGTISEGAARIIAEKTNGGMRDALSILEQCLTYSPTVDNGTVYEVVGLTDDDDIRRFSSEYLNGNIIGCHEIIDKVYREGNNLGLFARDLIAHGKEQLVRTNGNQWKGFILGIMSSMSHPLWDVDPRLCLELSCLDFSGAEMAKSRISPNQDNTSIRTAPVPAPDDTVVDSPPTPKEQGGLSLGDVTVKWNDILEAIKKERVSLRALVVEGVPTSLEKNMLVLTYRKEYAFHKENLSIPRNKGTVEQVVSRFLGCPITISPVMEGEESGKDPEKPANNNTPASGVDSLVSEAIRIFGGKLSKIGSEGE